MINTLKSKFDNKALGIMRDTAMLLLLCKLCSVTATVCALQKMHWEQ